MTPAERARRSRQAQGLEPTVTDDHAYVVLAALMTSAARRRGGDSHAQAA